MALATVADAAQTGHAHLAALRWLLLSSPLVAIPQGATAQLAAFTAQETASIVGWLDDLQTDSTELAAWLRDRPEARIGRYAERLLEFYLSQAHRHGQHRLVVAHVPLRSNVQGLWVTQGELDFLLTSAQGQRQHWELAVKFFLCTATERVATAADFIGPNGVETLAHKWHKLFARQLTHTPPAPWSEHTWQPQAFTRGWMFYRWGLPVPQCDALHPQHGKGWWTDIAAMHELPDALYLYLPRLHWMAPVASVAQLGPEALVFARDAMAKHLQMLWASGTRNNDAHMVVQLEDGAVAEGSLGEVQRFFIRPINQKISLYPVASVH